MSGRAPAAHGGARIIEFPTAAALTPPAVGPDLDGVGDRYTALLEARETGAPDVDLRAQACADDVPVLVAEISRLHRAAGLVPG